MKILEKINNLHQYISFNIFAFIGYLFLFFEGYNYYLSKSQSDAGIILLGEFFLVLILLNLAFVVFLLEQAFEFKIKNKFFTQNKILRKLRYIGSAATILFCSYILILLVQM